MDSTRFILITALLIVVMLLYQAWQEDYGKQDAAGQESAETLIEQEAPPLIADRPDLPETITEAKEPVAQEAAATKAAQTGKVITINTDNYKMSIDLAGGGIVKTELVKFPVSLEKPDQPFVLMDKTRDLFFVTQGGLLSRNDAPTHVSQFTSPQESYVLQDGQDLLEVSLRWGSQNGVSVTKVFEFQRGSYQIGVRYEVSNGSTERWNGQSYVQLKRNNPGRSSMFGTYTYTGAVISSPEARYEKITFEDIAEQELQQDISDGWAAMIQHYFVTAVLPVNKSDRHHFYTRALADGNFAIGMLTPVTSLAGGEAGIIRESIYIGPKIQGVLEEVADGLELTVDYGFLWFIAKPLFWCLEEFQKLTGNWGWSIILLTVILKLIFYPLSAAGYRSMANMRKIQPRLQSIRERYKDDKTRFNQAMMQLYKEEKINPMGGCLPILVQIPVFLALYWVLLESVEMRQAGFIFWLKDLSSPDPYYILPLLMGITMYITQKLNPAPLDPVQAKVMSILPIVFTVFFAFFQSGLVLYWVVNNILSIAQQWLITRNLERSGLQPKKT